MQLLLWKENGRLAARVPSEPSKGVRKSSGVVLQEDPAGIGHYLTIYGVWRHQSKNSLRLKSICHNHVSRYLIERAIYYSYSGNYLDREFRDCPITLSSV